MRVPPGHAGARCKASRASGAQRSAGGALLTSTHPSSGSEKDAARSRGSSSQHHRRDRDAELPRSAGSALARRRERSNSALRRTSCEGDGSRATLAGCHRFRIRALTRLHTRARRPASVKLGPLEPRVGVPSPRTGPPPSPLTGSCREPPAGTPCGRPPRRRFASGSTERASRKHGGGGCAARTQTAPDSGRVEAGTPRAISANRHTRISAAASGWRAPARAWGSEGGSRLLLRSLEGLVEAGGLPRCLARGPAPSPRPRRLRRCSSTSASAPLQMQSLPSSRQWPQFP